MDKLQEILNSYADKGYAEVTSEFISEVFSGKVAVVNNFTYHNNKLCVCLSDSGYYPYNVIPVSNITEVL